MPGEGVKTSSGPVGNPGWSVTYQSRDEQSFGGFDQGGGGGRALPWVPGPGALSPTDSRVNSPKQ